MIQNLTTFEAFFPEKRPFFTHGFELFQPVGSQQGAAPQALFYSRRIGFQAPILAAAKVTGGVANGVEASPSWMRWSQARPSRPGRSESGPARDVSQRAAAASGPERRGPLVPGDPHELLRGGGARASGRIPPLGGQRCICAAAHPAVHGAGYRRRARGEARTRPLSTSTWRQETACGARGGRRRSPISSRGRRRPCSATAPSCARETSASARM